MSTTTAPSTFEKKVFFYVTGCWQIRSMHWLGHSWTHWCFLPACCYNISMNPIPIFDGHNDTLLSLFDGEHGKNRSFFEQGESGQLDLPRARSGGYKGGLFAIF